MGTLAVDNIQHTDGSSAVTLNNTTITTGTVGSGVTVEGTLNSNTTFSGDAGQRTAKAWCNWNGTGTPAINNSFNVSSITDNSTGNYWINFGTAMPNINYACAGMTGDGYYGGVMYYADSSGGNFETGRVRMGCSISQQNSMQDVDENTLVVFGD